MLCESGLPGTENPLLCPIRPRKPLRSPLFKEIGDHIFTAATPSSTLMLTNAYIEPTPTVPFRDEARTQKRMSRFQNQMWAESVLSESKIDSHSNSDMKKIYLIPWAPPRESTIKPIVDFLLIPEDVLHPDAPLDVLKESSAETKHDEYKKEWFKRRRNQRRKNLRPMTPKPYVTTKETKPYYRRRQKYVAKPSFDLDEDLYETS